MDDYKWLSTHGSYKGLLTMLEIYVSVCMEIMCEINTWYGTNEGNVWKRYMGCNSEILWRWYIGGA